MKCFDLDECNICKDWNKSFTDSLNLVQARGTYGAKPEI